MQIGLRPFNAPTLTWLRQTLQQEGISRLALARGWCERSDWRNRRGQWCLSSAAKVLPQLVARLGGALPPPQPGGRGRLAAGPPPYPDVVVEADFAARDAAIGWTARARGAIWGR